MTFGAVTAAAWFFLGAADAAGDAARIRSVAFALSDGAAPAAAAREAAFADARRQAEQYAGLTGDGLGAVLHLSDDPSSAPRAEVHFAARVGSAAPAGPAMEPGEQTVTARVTVEWELV